jgi:ferredoxin
MKVTVDPDLCEVNALCVAEAPDVFELNDDEVVDILLPEPPTEMESAAIDADRLSEAGATDDRGLIRSRNLH